jgi:hypothetical protein
MLSPLTKLISSHTFPPSPTSSTTPSVRGVLNPGNTCYVNTVLTSLYNLRGFRATLLSKNWDEAWEGTPASPASKLLANLHAAFTQLHYSEDISVDLSPFYSTLNSSLLPHRLTRQQPNTPFDVTTEGDAREFYMILLSCLKGHKCEQLFKGELSKSVTTTTTTSAPTNTTTTTVTQSVFTYLTLPYKNADTFDQAFDRSLNGESQAVTGINDDGADSISVATTVTSYPEYLTLHLQRDVTDGPPSSSQPSSSSLFAIPEAFRQYKLLAAVLHGVKNSDEEGHVFSVLKVDGRWVKISDDVAEYLDEFPTSGAFLLFFGPGKEEAPQPPLDVTPISDEIVAANQIVRRRAVAAQCPSFTNFLHTLLRLSVNPLPLGLIPSSLFGRKIEVVWKNGNYVGEIVSYSGGKFSVLYDVDETTKEYKLHKKEFTYVTTWSGNPTEFALRLKAVAPESPFKNLKDPLKLFNKLCKKEYNILVRVANYVSTETHMSSEALSRLNDGKTCLTQMPNVIRLLESEAAMQTFECVAEAVEVNQQMLELASFVADAAQREQMTRRVDLGGRARKTVAHSKVEQPTKTAALVAIQAGNAKMLSLVSSGDAAAP